MPIIINLGTFHILVTTYLSYTTTGMSELSSFEIQVLQTELFWAAFKSSFPTSCTKYYHLDFAGESRRKITFERFAVFNQTAFIVNCLRSGVAHSLSRRVVQAMTVFGCFLCFPHKDFIASIRIFFAMKCRPIEDVRMYFWLETKMQGKQPPSNSLQSYLFLVTKLSFGKTVVRFSLSHFKSDLCMMTFTVFDR